MKQNTKLWFIAFGFLCSTTAQVANGQNNPSAIMTKTFPASPEVSSLGGYGNFGDASFSGTIDISIPLYTIQTRDLQVPIVLKYTGGSGIKIDEEATWAGLGWSLEAGGSISRTIRGRDDFQVAGFLSSLPIPDAICPAGPGCASMSNGPVPATSIICASGPMGRYRSTGTGSEASCCFYLVNGVFQNYNLITATDTDWERDAFVLSAPGIGGKFFLDQGFRTNKKVYFNDKQATRIEQGSAVNAIQANGFLKATDLNGTQFVFADKEVSEPMGGAAEQKVTAWHLTQLVSQTADSVLFQYESLPNTGGFSGFITSVPSITQSKIDNDLQEAIREQEYNTKYLKRIDFDNGYVLFVRDATQREDMQGGQRLSSIRVYDKTNLLIREIIFSHSYFVAGASTQSYYPSRTALAKRLKLDKITIKGGDGSCGGSYTFEYDAQAMPLKSSYARDMWGYFNGKNNSSLIPYHTDLSDGADRSADLNKCKAGVIKSITFPTGGKTTFEFELHTIDRAIPKTYNLYDANQVLRGGGLRIAKVMTNESPTSNTITKKYTYSGGKMPVLPNFFKEVPTTGGFTKIQRYGQNLVPPASYFGVTVGYTEVSILETNGSTINSKITNILN